MDHSRSSLKTVRPNMEMIPTRFGFGRALCVTWKSAFHYALGGASVCSPAPLLHPPEQHELHPQPQPFTSEPRAHNSPKSGLPQNHQPSPRQQPVKFSLTWKASIGQVELKHGQRRTQQMHCSWLRRDTDKASTLPTIFSEHTQAVGLVFAEWTKFFLHFA